MNAPLVRVFCYPASSDSQYVPLLFEGIGQRYRPVYRQQGALDDAIAAVDAGQKIVVHIHWEEFIFDDCASDAEADHAAAAFAEQIEALGRRDVVLFWTVHNEWPHSSPFRRQFLATRTLLAARADAILVHNAASIEALDAQVALDRRKLRLLPHPSYVGRYESEAALAAGLNDPCDRIVQGFGWIRRQKGFGEMIDALPQTWLAARGAHIRISGAGEEAADVSAGHADRTDIEWDIRHVPDAAVPRLLRSAACVVLPYERVLTSGVALLAMSVGALLVGVDITQLRDLLPRENHRFLYTRGNAAALRAVIDEVLALNTIERRLVIAANLAAIAAFRSDATARALAALYDTLLDASGDERTRSSKS